MKFARYWPLAAVAFGMGLVYVVLAQADSKAPPSQIPQPVDAVFEAVEAPWSPSDLPQLGAVYGTCKSDGVCSTGQCKLTRTTSAVATAECKSECANTCKTECETACGSKCATAGCESKVAVAACASKCTDACQGECVTACDSATSDFPTSVQTCVATAADCSCGTNCACAKDCACGENCKCSDKKQVWKASVAEAGHCKGQCAGDDCACPGQSAHGIYPNAPWIPHPPHMLTAPYADPGCGEQHVRPVPSLHVWAPPPPAIDGMPVPFAPSFGPPPQPEPHHAIHGQLVQAMTENARLAARDEAWVELQKRDRALAELAVQNARLQSQLELASHREKALEQAAELLAKNAALEVKLEAVKEREGLMEALMEVATEKARLEAATELLEVQHEIHADALGALVETRQELMAPLHEALVENASLKAQAATSEETTHLKARVAELEKAIAKAEKQAGKVGAPVKTAKKPADESEIE